MSTSAPQSPEPRGRVLPLTSLALFRKETERSDIITCVHCYTADCRVSSSEATYSAYDLLGADAELVNRVQFFRHDVGLATRAANAQQQDEAAAESGRCSAADSAAITAALRVSAVPAFFFFWEGAVMMTHLGGNVPKVKLMAKHCIQKRYLTTVEREKLEKERKAAEEAAAAAVGQ